MSQANASEEHRTLVFVVHARRQTIYVLALMSDVGESESAGAARDS